MAHKDYEDIYSGSEHDEFTDIYSGRQDVTPKRNINNINNNGNRGSLPYGVQGNVPNRNVYSNERRSAYSNYAGAFTPENMPETEYSNPAARRQRQPYMPSDPGKKNVPPSRRVPKGKAKKRKGKKILAVILVLLLLLTGTVGYLGYNLVNKINYVPSKHSNLYLNEDKLMSDPKVKNILFIGCDDDSGGSSRSDSIMLVSIDKNNKKIKLTSFMRDCWVYIPDNDYAKLNAAYSYGGAGLLMDTIEYNFGVKIDNYALVDFDIFSSIINELGGVTVEVTEKEANFINSTTRQTVKAGKTTLNGDEALVYCRIRKLDSDFMRTSRQRKVMTAIVNKVKNAGLFTMYDLAETILPQVKTDITKGEMIFLGLGALGYLSYDTEQLRIPVDGTYSDQYFGSQQALSIDFDANKKAIREFIYE